MVILVVNVRNNRTDTMFSEALVLLAYMPPFLEAKLAKYRGV